MKYRIINCGLQDGCDTFCMMALSDREVQLLKNVIKRLNEARKPGSPMLFIEEVKEKNNK